MPGTAMSSTISILLPTYEPRADFLRAALDSVIAQSEQCWTLHIHDDASSIDVCTMVKPYLEDPRITFARNARHLGIGANWNACLGVAFGAKPGPFFIQFLFQDDTWSPHYLERACGILETHPTIGFVSVEHTYDCDGGVPTAPLYESLRAFRSAYITPGLHRGDILLDRWLSCSLHPNIIGEPSFVMLRRSLVERVGLFDEHMPQFLDVEYWTRCLVEDDWYFLQENLGAFRVHIEGASERNRRGGRGMVDRLLCTERAIDRLPNNLRQKHTHTLSRTLEDMIGKFQQESTQKNAANNPLRLLPLLPFSLRHPLVVGQALFTKISS